MYYLSQNKNKYIYIHTHVCLVSIPFHYCLNNYGCFVSCSSGHNVSQYSLANLTRLCQWHKFFLTCCGGDIKYNEERPWIKTVYEKSKIIYSFVAKHRHIILKQKLFFYYILSVYHHFPHVKFRLWISVF